MRRLRLAVAGFGRLGRACADAVLLADDLTLVAIARRPEKQGQPLPKHLRPVPVVTDVGDFREIDGVLLCLPEAPTREAAHDLLQHRVPLVECAALHGAAFQGHKEAIHRMALRHRTAAVVGAGWDPGALSLFRGLFALLTPKGHTDTRERAGVSLHHTLSAKAVTGVRDALCTELRSPEGRMQRYVYVELEQGADPDRVQDAVRAEPLFLDEETLVFPVPSVAALEDETRGVLLERRGTAGVTGHQLLLLEARFDLPALAAQVMLAGARALPALAAGAHSLYDLPLGALWGISRDRAQQEWI
jgi:diaminopimelate dehydrogenase